MTNLNIEKEYDDPTSWFNFTSRQLLKKMYTCLPGLVKKYDSSTKRAQIQIALTLVKTDGTELSYPTIADVPVIFPGSAQYILQFPLAVDDGVLVLFSQRGLTEFKQTYAESTPDTTSFFSLHDAIAVPGFGQLTNTPAVSDAITIQTTDANTSISLSPEFVTIKALNIVLDGNVQANYSVTVGTNLIVTDETSTSSLSLAGNSLPTNHKHGGVSTGGGETGTPIS